MNFSGVWRDVGVGMGDGVMAVEGWYREHGPAVLAYLRRRFGGVVGLSAEDLLQETFVMAMRGAGRAAAAESVRAWLFGIARNVGLTAARRKTGRAVELVGDVEARSEDGDERNVEVRRAIGELPEAMREALELRVGEGLSYEEIAAVLGVPVGTVRSRLHNAVQRLRETLVEE